MIDTIFGSKWARGALVLSCIGFSLLSGFTAHRADDGTVGMMDFGEIYYGARCALQHNDPYNPSTVLQEFRAEGGRLYADGPAANIAQSAVAIGQNLPTALFLVSPFAMLSWKVAETLWVVIIAALLALAGYLMWSLVGNAALGLSGCLIGFVLFNSELIFAVGNLAGIAVSLCIVATWCFLRERYIEIAIVLFAVSLALKPHDAGFVWFYFLLAGGVMRKRALQVLAVVAILAVLAAAWIAPASPHWIQELHSNLVTVSQRGGTSDPGLTGLTNVGASSIIDLQTVFSVFRNEPSFYNLGSYLLFGPLILIWALLALRKGSSPGRDPLALAAVASLSLLPVYHRPYDAKLLMLTIPAFAMLCAQGGIRRWLAIAVTSSGILATSDLPLALLFSNVNHLHLSLSTFIGKLEVAFILRAPPLILLATGCFYLWAFARPSNPAAQADSPVGGLEGASAA